MKSGFSINCRYARIPLGLLIIFAHCSIFGSPGLSAQAYCQAYFLGTEASPPEAIEISAGSLNLPFPMSADGQLDFSGGISSIEAMSISGTNLAANAVLMPEDAQHAEGLSYEYLIEIANEQDTVLLFKENVSFDAEEDFDGIVGPDTRIRYAGIMYDVEQFRIQLELFQLACELVEMPFCEVLESAQINNLLDFAVFSKFTLTGSSDRPNTIAEMLYEISRNETSLYEFGFGEAAACFVLTDWDQSNIVAQLYEEEEQDGPELIDSYYRSDMLSLHISCQEGQAGQVVYEDFDSDGLGNPKIMHWVCEGSIPVGYVLNALDENDTCALNEFDECGQCSIESNPQLNYCLDLVYPGDANLDGIVNNEDVLSLGLQFMYIGPPRGASSTDWIPQVCLNWLSWIPNTNTDSKHTDCTGDGMVNADDLQVIEANYGMQHRHIRSHLYQSISRS